MRFGFPPNVSAVGISLTGCRSRDAFNPNDGVGAWLLPLFASLLKAERLDCGLASTPLVRSGVRLPAAIPDPIGIDVAIRLLGCAGTAACDSTAVESKALLGGPARCDAAAVGGPKTGAEAMFLSLQAKREPCTLALDSPLRWEQARVREICFQNLNLCWK